MDKFVFFWVKPFFMKYNTYSQDHICYVCMGLIKFRIDPRNVLPRKEELLRFMEETDLQVSFCEQL